jgi:NADH:ubiquinone oxidoreductase subunit H
LLKGKLRLGFKIVWDPTEQVKAVLQPLADGLKVVFEEEFEPNTPNKFLFILDQQLP